MVEQHPLKPFLPEGTRLLMLGSFPPQQKRWSMDFFYPNFLNDMWRIFALIFKDDKLAFVDAQRKCFNREPIIDLLNELGVGLYDTATEIVRLKDNASDKFLEIQRPTDVRAILRSLPQCVAVTATGQKAAEEISRQFGIDIPATGGFTNFDLDGRTIAFYRMPSSSRAYPLALEKKAAFYRRMFEEIGMLH